jgi:prolyl-tRNA synthetase
VDDEQGQQQPLVMGCYGIGVSRIVAALVEAHHDDNGISWPATAAPFQVAVLLLDPDQPEPRAIAEKLVADLEAAGLEAILDDRAERPGVKFKDADLIGYPLRAVIGRRTAESGEIELRRRRDAQEQVVSADQAVGTARAMLAS